ncbi:unnamed protein product [Allacma fusca]|uniref:HECT domain-containing protein n=1 Tax=Allacma fusca TaxID=39272 RepID=A0A8J2LE33_9HEXA|nr:unnamed protein product [Allacma fusca]
MLSYCYISFVLTQEHFGYSSGVNRFKVDWPTPNRIFGDSSHRRQQDFRPRGQVHNHICLWKVLVRETLNFAETSVFLPQFISMDRESLMMRVQALTSGLNEIVASLGNSESSSSGRINAGNSNSYRSNEANNSFSDANRQASLSTDNELRQRFAPYSSSSPSVAGTSMGLLQTIRSHGNVNAGQLRSVTSHRSRRNFGLSPKTDPGFSRRIVFLGDKFELTAPGSARIGELEEGGLKEDVVLSTRNSTGAELYNAISELFTQSNGKKFPDLVLNWTIGYVRGRGNLKITYFDSCPSPMKIIGLKISCLYARPDRNLVPIDHELQTLVENSDDEFQNNIDPVVISSSAHITHSDSADYTGLTHEAFQARIRQNNLGTQIIQVSQITDVHISLESELRKFRTGEICPHMLPRIRMSEVDTIDAGGPLRAYIWTLLKKSLISNVFNGVPIFEGEMNHLVPVRDVCLLNDEVFYALGKFLGFSILNASVGFFGISPIVTNFLVSETDDSFQESITEFDIPYSEFRVAVNKLEHCFFNGNAALLGNVQSEVRDVLLDSGWTYQLRMENVMAAVKHLKMYSVVTIRKEELMQMKMGFQSTDVSRWLSCNRSLVSQFFKDASCIKPSVADIITAFGVIDVCVVRSFNHLCNYLQRISTDDPKIADFIQAITGSVILGNHKLIFQEDSTITEFRIDTCECSLRVIPYLSQEQFYNKMDTLMTNSTFGFSKA